MMRKNRANGFVSRSTNSLGNRVDSILAILPTGHIDPPAQRALRDLARKPIQLVRSRTQHVRSVENILARTLDARPPSNAFKRLSVEGVDALRLVGDVTLAAKANVAIIAALNTQIDPLEQRPVEGVTLQREFALLKIIHGFGEVLGMVILLETGDITRFVQVGNFAAYARCVDSTCYSNGKKKGEGSTKNGNAYLVWAFIEAANFARRFYKEANAFFKKKKAKTNGVVATKALAHKLRG